MQKDKYAIFIVGPTAVGKTKVSIEIAKKNKYRNNILRFKTILQGT